MKSHWALRIFLLALSFPIWSHAVLAGQTGHHDEVSRSYLIRRWDTLYIDQDLFAGEFNEDRNYTMGLMLDWSGDKAQNHLLNSRPALDRLDTLFRVEHAVDAFEHVSIGVSAFTPDRLDLAEVISDDRPYGSIVYSATSRSSTDLESRTTWSSQLHVGMLGTPIAKWGQTAIHAFTRTVFTHDQEPFKPRGWHHQISHGGEPTAMYTVGWSRMPVRMPMFDLTYGGDVSAGYYTKASAAAVIRFGYINIGNAEYSPSFPDPFGEVGPQRGGSYARRHDPAKRSLEGTKLPPGELYLLLGGRITAVGYNALLQGQFRDSDHEVHDSQVEHRLLEAYAGAAWTRANGWHASFTCTRRSPEHELDQRRWHAWCGLNVSNPWSF